MWFKFMKAVFRGEFKLNPMTWVTAIVAVIYTAVPVDLVPEMFLGPLGFIDDLGLWGVVVMLATREKNRFEVEYTTGPEVVDATRVDH